MKLIMNILILISSFFLIASIEMTYSELRQYPACNLGRLQSPIQLDEENSSYSNEFSFVYQNYVDFKTTLNTANYLEYTFKTGDVNGGTINFEKNGVIKQYKFIRAELYPGLHPIDNEFSDYELHLIHKKNLAFTTNKNQYKNITDPNMYLTVVLRYMDKSKCKDNINCISDKGLLANLMNGNSINLNSYSFFQDKRAYYYEGSFLQLPCDENVNYYVVKDYFNYSSTNKLDFSKYGNTIKYSNRYGRPVYRNFMSYEEVLKCSFIETFTIKMLILMFILF